MRRILLVVALLCFLPGCRGAGWFVGGALLGAAIAADHHHTEVVYEPIYVVSGPSVYVPPPPPPARDTPPEPPPPSFDQAAARESLDAVDLDGCGAPRGWGHAKVTFAAAGNVTKVVVDSPSGLSTDTVACIGQRLGTAEVPAFDGAPVTVGKQWRVR